MLVVKIEGCFNRGLIRFQGNLKENELVFEASFKGYSTKKKGVS